MAEAAVASCWRPCFGKLRAGAREAFGARDCGHIGLSVCAKWKGPVVLFLVRPCRLFLLDFQQLHGFSHLNANGQDLKG